MKIAVITLPLHTNYGGLLQAYALRKYLLDMGHDVTVIDRKEKMPLPKGVRAPFVYASRILRRMFKGKEGHEIFRELRFRRELPVVSEHLLPFVREIIRPRMVDSYSDIEEGEYDAFIVGSDQVWRPRYFGKIEDAFLEFTEGWDVIRLSYAASFGTDALEFDYMLLEKCSSLLSHFDAVSVREESALKSCEDWLECPSAVHVLDPVMLLDVAEYMRIASPVESHPGKGCIVEYVLDPDRQKSAASAFLSKISGKSIYTMKSSPYDVMVPLEERVAPSMAHWLAGFRDADFVVTDSFHGCVLCILFHKPFIAVGNHGRGNARLTSLLGMFGLEGLMVHGIDPEDDGSFFLDGPSWDEVDNVLARMRKVSGEFLMNALKK